MKPKVYLAPMSGVTDLAFRLISRKMGVRQCFYEMLDANAMIYNHPGNRRLLKTIKADSPIAGQLVGAEPSIMLDAAVKLTTLADISFLDINAGCPAKKVIKKKAGSALLNDPARFGKIIKKISSKIKIPVTVKIRSGFLKRDVKACVKIAKLAEDSGASTLFIHGRTMVEAYSGDIDYEVIKAVKEALKIPVFGSGNILNPEMAKRMLDETGCDGVIVARGALGNPWIFKSIKHYLETGILPKPPSLGEKKRVLKEHLSYIDKYKEMVNSNKSGFMGKITMWYLKGVYNAAKYRNEISKVKSYKELLKIISKVR